MCSLAGNGWQTFTCMLLMCIASTSRGEAPDTASVYADLLNNGFEVVEFSVMVKGQRVPAVMVSPGKDKLASDPALLLSIGTPHRHLMESTNNRPTRYFLERGHRVVCMEAPSVAQSIGTFGELTLEGLDPSQEFIDNAQGVIGHCIAQNWGRPGRIVATGISRYAYMALRLVAEDDRVQFCGGFAPVTDWRDLSELADVRDRKEIADLRLSKFADKLAGKKIYLTIGNHDERVGTKSCCQFFLDLNKANEKRGFSDALVDFNVTPDKGHTCGDEWYDLGMQILLNAVTSPRP